MFFEIEIPRYAQNRGRVEVISPQKMGYTIVCMVLMTRLQHSPIARHNMVQHISVFIPDPTTGRCKSTKLNP